MLSLEVPLAGAREPVGDTLTEEDGLAAWHGQACCAAAVTELHHALQAALARLPAEDRRFWSKAPVKLPKRLDLARDADRALDSVPGLIVANWVDVRL